jgi:hypothetical protein
MFLFAEAFDAPDGARIPGYALRERLPEALALVRERQKNLYKATEKEIAEAEQSFRDFVALFVVLRDFRMSLPRARSRA